MSRFRALRQQLHISIDRSGYRHHTNASSSPPSSKPLGPGCVETSRFNATTAPDNTETPSTSSASGRPEWLISSVLCLHDFESSDPDHLPFRQNEILDIVKQELTGWWAALRPNGGRVGWIPSAYVTELDTAELDNLQLVDFDVRVHVYKAGRLENSSPLSQLRYKGAQDDGWVDCVQSTDIIPERECLNSRSIGDFDFYSTVDIDVPSSARLSVPPSPLTPTPQPPLVTAPLLINKSAFLAPTHPSSSASVSNPREVGQNSSDTASADRNGRIWRRRPVLVDDRVSLSRLSALIDTNDATEVEILTSPQMSGSFDAFSGALRRTPEKMIHPFPQDSNDPSLDNTVLGQSKLPCYIRPDLHSDTLQLDPQGQVKAGTLSALLERLIGDHSTELADETAFPNVFLMTFRSFASPELVFQKLVERYQMVHPTSLTSEQFEYWKVTKLQPTQQRILAILMMWLEHHHFLDEEPHMTRDLTEFLALIVTPAPLALTAKRILYSLERLTSACLHSQPDESSGRKKTPKAHKNDLLRLDPTDVAEQLCLYEHRLYKKIRPQECLNWAKTQSGSSVTNMVNFCATHEKLAAWVKISILNNDILGKRVDIVDFWIKVAEKCRFLNNFASMSAIITALSATVVSRLHLTWALASRKSHLDALLEFNEPAGRFSGYRTLLQSVEGACVPFLTMFLTDIVHIQDQMPDNLQVTMVQEPLVYFHKRQRWYCVISAMLRYQSQPYTFPDNDTTRRFIDDHLRTANSKDQGWFWHRSREVQQTELVYTDIRKGLEAAGL